MLHNALRPFKIYCTPPIYYFPASRISVSNRRNKSTGTCESCWSSPKLCPKMRSCDNVRDSHSHSRCSTVSLPLRQLLHKGFMSFPILYNWPYRPRCPASRPTTMDSCCLLILNSLVALLCWGPSMRTLESLQSLLDFQVGFILLKYIFRSEHQWK